MAKSTIYYTLTDEAPALATASFLPMIRSFVEKADIDIQLKDISLAGRILANFPECVPSTVASEDALHQLGEMAKSPDANIVKLPNISASVPQLKAAIQELQEHGISVPDYPDVDSNDEQKKIKAKYAKVLGSAVNPVLREGNSDRRVAAPVKKYAQSHPHSMGAWSSESKSHVAHMNQGDFYANEKSQVMDQDGSLRIEHVDESGKTSVLKDQVKVNAGDVVDASLMQAKELRSYFADQIEQAHKDGTLLSLHLKATMMKVSDPIIFGHAVSTFLDDVFSKHKETFAKIGVNANNGLGDLYKRLQGLPPEQRQAIEADIQDNLAKRPALAMVDSDKGITNLHIPSDIIIDASMPAAIRESGKMWGPDGKLHDTKCLIPDRCYAGIYQEVISFCKTHGAFDPRTMGSVSNVGLMAQKAEEYGSHDKTFEIPAHGKVVTKDASGKAIFEHRVEAGDIWRMCQTKDIAIRDWVKLAVNRARASGHPAIFWLDPQRPHDMHLKSKAETYLKDHDTSGLEILIKSPLEAIRLSMERIKAGKDTISVTGNVLRDYLTDLFPILELGTSAKMLSIVPLLEGGGLYETGAGGSAPKHVQQFLSENFLRWDSLGEFLALAVSLEELAEKSANSRAKILAQTLNQATTKFLNENKSPDRSIGGLDNRGSHFYLALYWSEALAAQSEDSLLKQCFDKLANNLQANEAKILDELKSVQGKAVDIGGYYHPDLQKVTAAMRPSPTLVEALQSF